MNIRPLADRVLLKAVAPIMDSKSGIYIPESAQKERPFMYEVISVWPGKEGVTMSLNIWDKVLSGQYSWDDVKVDWKDYKIVAMDYILAVVED